MAMADHAVGDASTTSKLAPELLTAILAYLDPSAPDSAVALTRFATANKHFCSIADDPKLWKRLFISRWKRHRSRADYLDLLLRDGAGISWKAAYGQRHRQDAAALRAVQQMCKVTNGRYALAQEVLQEYKMGVFDSLLSHEDSLQAFPRYERLNERLWTRQILGALRRSESLQIWMQMIASGGEISFVRAIGAFSGFRGCDQFALEARLEALGTSIQNSLGVEWLASQPDQVDVSKRICEELRKFVAPATDDRDFLKLQNHFLNLVLDGQTQVPDGTPVPSRTLPMSLVCIFCAVAQKVGLRASMIAFPSRIIARIAGWADKPEEGQEVHVLDIFEGGRVLSPEDINTRLSFVGIPANHAYHFLRPASPNELVARVGRNIIQSLQRDDEGAHGGNDTSRSAHAAVAALLFLQPNNLIDALPNILQQFPIDVYSIEQDYIPVVTREGREGMLMGDRLRTLQRVLVERDASEVQPRLREQEKNAEKGDNKDITHHIGTVFRHRKWGYVGVITRWDPRCCADELWIRSNNVDALDNDGRSQPFYSIHADDGSSRYIAQVNVVPMKTVHTHTINKIVDRHENLGLTFTHALPSKGLFVLDPTHRLKYPEDAAWQDEQLRST